jgi:hypothetical protein
VIVCFRVARLKDAGVNAPAQVLNERPEQTAVQLRNAKIGIDDDLGFIHRKWNWVGFAITGAFAVRTVSSFRIDMGIFPLPTNIPSDAMPGLPEMRSDWLRVRLAD